MVPAHPHGPAWPCSPLHLPSLPTARLTACPGTSGSSSRQGKAAPHCTQAHPCQMSCVCPCALLTKTHSSELQTGSSEATAGLDLALGPVLGLPSPAVTGILLISLEESPQPLIPNHPQYLIEFSALHPWHLSPRPAFSQNPLPLMSLLSNFPSHPTPPVGSKSPPVLAVSRAELTLPPLLQQRRPLGSWVKPSFPL